MKQTIFVSSVQKELAAERQAVRDFVRNDPVLRRFFDVFLFEDLPAADRRADEVYLSQVNQCGIYLGLFGNDYGYEDKAGVSPTEREFDRATVAGKPRLVFVKGSDDRARHPKMAALVRKAGDQLIRRRFTGVPDLLTAVHASLADHLELHGMVQTRPFEERPCRDARVDDIDPGAVTTFLRRAHNERQFPLAEGTPVADVLTHLHLLVDDRLSNAAILLFGRDPQKFIPCAETRCMHFHGTEIQRPVPFYRIFKGNLFEQVDEAVDFVLSKVNRSVGTRAEGPRAPVRYELPENVVSEAVVNAIVHRDYTSSSAIQISVFADRVEVWNPGELLPPLTAESLRKPHRSILRNTRIAEALYLAHYIEKYGTGTLMMIRESIDYALPEPQFGTKEPGEFGITVWRDWLTEEVMQQLGLNERQMKAIEHLKTHGRISNPDYRAISGSSKQTASRDLEQLRDLQVLARVGSTGKGTYYVLKGKGLTKGSMGSAKPMGSQRAQWAQPDEREDRRGNNASGAPRIPTKETRHKPDKPVDKRGQALSRTAKAGAESKARDRSGVQSQGYSPRGTVAGVRSRKQCPGVQSPMAIAALRALGTAAMGKADIATRLGKSGRTRYLSDLMRRLLNNGLVEYTIPDKPTSRLQKYRLTPKGRERIRMKVE